MKSGLIIISLALITSPFSCEAFFLEDLFEEIVSQGENQSQIINKVHTSVNTGETIINGEVKEGKKKTVIEIKNVVNGEEIEPIEIETEAGEVEVKQEIEIEDEQISINQEVEIDSEENHENYKNKSENVKDFLTEIIIKIQKLIENIFNIFK